METQTSNLESRLKAFASSAAQKIASDLSSAVAVNLMPYAIPTTIKVLSYPSSLAYPNVIDISKINRKYKPKTSDLIKKGLCNLASDSIFYIAAFAGGFVQVCLYANFPEVMVPILATTNTVDYIYEKRLEKRANGQYRKRCKSKERTFPVND